MANTGIMRQTLEDIRKKLTENAYKNEEHVRLSLVARLLNELEWDIWDPSEVYTEFYTVPNEDRSRVDVALFLTPYSPSVFIEVKAVGKLLGDISQVETQLRNYNRNNTATFTIITDGQRWRFYYSQTGGEFSKKCFKTLDFLNDELDELEETFQLFLSRIKVENGDAVHSAESYLQLNQKQRAMGEVFHQARKAILVPPYPSLPQAIVELTSKAGLVVTLEEAAQFVREFSEDTSYTRKIIPEKALEKTSKRVHVSNTEEESSEHAETQWSRRSENQWSFIKKYAKKEWDNTKIHSDSIEIPTNKGTLLVKKTQTEVTVGTETFLQADLLLNGNTNFSNKLNLGKYEGKPAIERLRKIVESINNS